MRNGTFEASDWTLSKLQHFESFLKVYSWIVAAIQTKGIRGNWTKDWRLPLLYLDLTSGRGRIPNNGSSICGTPLIALKTFAAISGLKVDCVFIERNPAFAYELERNASELYRCFTPEQQGRLRFTVRCTDYRYVLENARYPERQLGLLCWDGFGADVYPEEHLREWLSQHGKHDLLVMASANALKRMGLTRLDARLRTSPRQFWISKTWGPWQWVFAFVTGCSWLAKKLSAKFPLYPADSSQGRRILDVLGTTSKERFERDQLSLL